MKTALLCLLLLCSSALAVAEPKLWFVFFTKGDGPRPEDKEELAGMQKAHLGNMDKRFNEKRLIAAGPIKDPTGSRRGIVILTVKDRKAVDDCFKEDPYVQNRIMGIELYRWDAPPSTINTKFEDPNAMEENRLVILSQMKDGKPSSDLLRKQHQYLQAALDEGTVSSYGRCTDAKGYMAIVLCQGTDEIRLLTIINGSPMVKGGWIKVDAMPWWSAKGTLREPNKEAKDPD